MTNKYKSFPLYLPCELKKALELEAKQYGLSLTAYIRLILMNRGKNDKNNI
jgi:hypothetical protein